MGVIPDSPDLFFDAEDTAALGRAYEATLAACCLKEDSPSVVRETIAKRIIELASPGRIECDRLSKDVLESLGITK